MSVSSPIHKYISRGFKVEYDFTLDNEDFILDGEWHILDLSLIIPTKAKLLHLVGNIIISSLVGSDFVFSPYPHIDLDSNLNYLHATTIVNNPTVLEIWCPVKSDRKIEYRSEVLGAIDLIELLIKGWFT